ncbi:hypothetical protein jhhlp_000791 [Lomentospora prolificans]|uniref:Uncharacterized protein n=1 Tax=Lomentospora prolificans TaxID=41688 RepID=A0A2N3NJH4_9PEZI|nr:hypothetical protein jhhlp_000791 [Lomentospora prolificans]
MPPTSDPALRRDVVFSDLRDPSTILGGLILTHGVTNEGFYRMVSIVLISKSDIFIQTENGNRLLRDSQPLLRGHYLIISDSEIQVNSELFLHRTISLGSGNQAYSFRDTVRQRDRRCVITKIENPDAEFGEWWGYKAAHVFPLAHESYCIAHNFDRWITIRPAIGGSINSVQNGILLMAHLHDRFNSYAFSIDPDDNYKIICFRQDQLGIAGTFLDRRLLDDSQRPPDELFRWHFRQAVLANMRGAGEPVFEHDFPPGSDIMGDIISGPKPAERMESELFMRLGSGTS